MLPTDDDTGRTVRAWLNLRYTVPARRRAFTEGLQRHGYEVCDATSFHPGSKDILITWNRIGAGQHMALSAEKHGIPVLVTENSAWGNDFAGERWYSLAKTYHNTAGRFPIGDSTRWDSLNIQLADWKQGEHTIILPQRGIGSAPTAMPRAWPQKARKRHGGRIRPHPGRHPGKPLEKDLKNCGKVVTWGSGAAIKALMLGVPVYSDMPDWIGEQDNTDEGRLAMFRKLAWAQWRLSEISSGEAFAGFLS